jgi:hypothetical protein
MNVCEISSKDVKRIEVTGENIHWQAFLLAM